MNLDYTIMERSYPRTPQIKCPTDTGSFMVAVDPKTFKLLSSCGDSELVPGRNTIAQFQGKEYIYPLGTSHLFRY